MTLDACAAVCVERCPARHRTPDDEAQAEKAFECLQEICLEKGWCYCTGARTFSVLHPKNRQKWLHLAKIEYDGLPVSDFEVAGELAHALNVKIGCWHKGAPHTGKHWTLIGAQGTWHYYYCRAFESSDLAYVDISRAYFQIYSAVANWDVRYQRCQSLGWGHTDIPAESIAWLRRNRAARNGLIGVAGSRFCQMCRPDGTTYQAPCFGRTNYQLALLVLDTLQSVMYQTHERFKDRIYYMNTDGIIADGAAGNDILCYWLERWGIEGSTKQRGEGAVRELGAYKIGDLISLNYARSSIREGTLLSRTRGIRDVARFLHREFSPYLKARPAGYSLR